MCSFMMKGDIIKDFQKVRFDFAVLFVLYYLSLCTKNGKNGLSMLLDTLLYSLWYRKIVCLVDTEKLAITGGTVGIWALNYRWRHIGGFILIWKIIVAAWYIPTYRCLADKQEV